MVESVKVITKDMISMELEQGGKLLLAPVTGNLYGEPGKQAELYIALPDGESSVFLTHSEVSNLIYLMRENPERH